MPDNDYKQLDCFYKLENCPVCGSVPQAWQYVESRHAPVEKVVMCSYTQPIGTMQNGLVNEGCLLYMPPEQFYQPTLKAAVEYWNEFAKALSALRRANNWNSASVLRDK